jgi:uncharacterized membrane protein
MKNHSRIRFNPVTKEIEVEGAEEFVKIYFDKLQAMISGAPEENAAIKKEPKPVKARATKKAKKTTKKERGIKRVTNIDMIVGLIQGSTGGISTAELKAKAGLSETQIWGIVNRAKQMGKIKQGKRGMYVAT